MTGTLVQDAANNFVIDRRIPFIINVRFLLTISVNDLILGFEVVHMIIQKSCLLEILKVPC